MEDLHRLAGRLRRECPELELRENELMAKYTTFRVGGPAALMALPKTEEEAQAALRAARKLGVEPFFLGNGSNLLVPDGGVSGVVIQTGPNFSYIRKSLKEGEIICAAGASLSAVAAFAQKEGLTGLEFAWGIPGNLGGALFMNAGAYGGEMKDVAVSADYVDGMGNARSIAASEMQLGYRHSIFADRDWCITKVKLQLRPGDPAQIRQKMEELMARRKAKQPLEYPSAGSIFKRPEGNYAGALIEQCGLKGQRIGGAQVSEKHAGFIVNLGGASSRDVTQLIREIQNTVEEQTGYRLECELRQL